MTSGTFSTFPLDKIFVNRDARHRRELRNIDDLAESINRIGLIHPIVIQRSGELRAGERRYTAVKQLGWTAMPVQFIEDLDEAQLQIVELEENIRREDITWQEHCDAIKTYDELRRSNEPDWTTTQTAETLGLTFHETREKIVVAKELEQKNERIVNAPKYSVARGIVRRETERRKATTLESINEPAEVTPKVKAPPLRNIDFISWQPKFKNKAKFNFIHCDFPYGINSGNHAQGGTAAMGSYTDSEEVYWNLVSTLEAGMNNLVAESAHLMFWYNIAYHCKTVERLTAMGWRVNPFPLIWLKSDNTGILPDPQRGPRRIYETALFASRGDRKIVRAVSNGFAAPTTKLIHPHEKALSMLEYFFQMFVDEYTLMLDPTCGSAGAVKIAEKMGANKVLGLEKDKEFFTLAKEAFYAND